MAGDPLIEADIHKITTFRDGVGLSTDGTSLAGTLATVNNHYSSLLTKAPVLGQEAGSGAFAEANDLALKYPQMAAALIGPNSGLNDLVLHLERLHDAADNAVSQYSKGVYTEANAAQTLKDSVSNWTPPLTGA